MHYIMNEQSVLKDLLKVGFVRGGVGLLMYWFYFLLYIFYIEWGRDKEKRTQKKEKICSCVNW